MALTSAQEKLLDRIFVRARQGDFARHFHSGSVSANVQGKRLRVTIEGAVSGETANAWIAACTIRAGNATRRPSARNARLIIDISLP